MFNEGSIRPRSPLLRQCGLEVPKLGCYLVRSFCQRLARLNLADRALEAIENGGDLKVGGVGVRGIQELAARVTSVATMGCLH